MPRWFLSTSPGYARIAPEATDAFTPVAAFTLRTGGSSDPPFDSLNLSEGVGDDAPTVRANRARLLGALGLDPASVAYATQVHGATCLSPTAPGWAGEADALATRQPGITLAVGTADCMGLILWDPSPDPARRAVAAVHSGWRGMVSGAVRAAVRCLVETGARAADLRVALGPRIGPCCFEVGADVAAQFAPEERIHDAGRLTVDLARAARRELASAGVAAASIRDAGDVFPARACTSCNAERFFSHRRDRGRTGRAWALVALSPAQGAQRDETPA